MGARAITAVLVAICESLGGTVQAQDERRTIIVHVTVTTPAGKPLAGVPLVAQSSVQHQVKGRTAADGRADISLEVPRAQSEVSVQVSPGAREPGEDLEKSKAGMAEWRGLLARYRFPRRVDISVTPDTHDCEAAIIGVPAITITGRAVNKAGKPLVVAVWHEGPVARGRAREDGRFEIGGVPDSAESEIYLWDEKRIVVPVAVRPPLEGNDLGDIIVDAPASDATVQVGMEMGGPKRFGGGVTGVLLVSSRGDLVLTGTVHVSYEPEYGDWVRERDTFTVPAGTYYMAPGLPLFDAVQVKLLKLARSGQDLSATQIPRFTIAAGQHVVVPLDPTAAKESIEREVVLTPK